MKTVYTLIDEREVVGVYDDSTIAYQAALDRIIEQVGVEDIVELLYDSGIRVDEAPYFSREEINE